VKTPNSPDDHSALAEILQKLPLPEGFRELMEELGPRNAVCQYLAPDGCFPDHLLKLHREGNLPSSIESLVLQPEWKEFFDEPLLIEAADRLQEIASTVA
jgi:hypothetical protein